jgi:hypothetical protein
MATVRQLYDTEIKGDSMGPEGPFPLEMNNSPLIKPIIWKMLQSHINRSTIFVFYIPDNIDYFQIGKIILENTEWVVKLKTDLIIKTTTPGEEEIDLSDTIFTGRFIFYIENNLKREDLYSLQSIAQSKNISLIIRDQTYLNKVEQKNKPIAFISHDSRDKIEIVGPIAKNLIHNMCPVWYDEFSLQPGDNLRENIEKGIKECRKCILVLTPNFISNNGWTKKEFDSIFTRELIENDRIIIPIWAGVSKEDVFNYSPSLANTVAINWKLGLEEVTKKLIKTLI